MKNPKNYHPVLVSLLYRVSRKKYPANIPKPNISVEPSSAVDINNPSEPPAMQPNPLPETNSDKEDIICPPNAPTRPQRQRPVPNKFSDFVMYWIILFVFHMGAE